MENEYLLLQGLNDQDLRLNLLHWTGLRMPKAPITMIVADAEALFGYIRFGVVAESLKYLPSKRKAKDDTEEK